MKLFIHSCIFLFAMLLFPLFVSGGTTGDLFGTVHDSLTGKMIAGVSVQIENTELKILTDKNGDFTIQNLPPGLYDLKLTMIGYIPLYVRMVSIKADSYSRLDLPMVSDVLGAGPEIVVMAEPALSQFTTTAAVRSVSGDAIINALPVQSIQEAIAIQPGCGVNHIRGGRNAEIRYLVDGLPVQDIFYRKNFSPVPLNSISDLNIITGGFSAEYGAAMSGIINIITKESGDCTEAHLRVYSDNLGLSNQYENMNHLDFYLGGPVLLGFGGPVYNFNYFISGSFLLSDTRWHDELTQTINSPVIRNFDFNIKLLFNITPKLSVMLQALLSNHRWHEYRYQWKNNLEGLPEFKNSYNRYSVSIRHRLTTYAHYSVYVSFSDRYRAVSGERADQYEPLIRENPEQFNSPIIDGQMQWWEKLSETDLIFKSDVSYRFNKSNRLKFGFEFNPSVISIENIRFDEVLINGNMNHFSYNVFENDLNYRPFSTALYLQDRIEFKDILVNIGMRLEMFNSKSHRPQRDISIATDTLRIQSQSSTLKSQINPRFGILFPLTSSEKFSFNYGWYVQMPALYYSSINPTHSFEGAYPILGSPDLSFEKTILYEVQYMKLLARDKTFRISYFQKEAYHLVSAKVHQISSPPPQGQSVTSPIAYCEYTNQAHSTIYGFEASFDAQLTPFFAASVAYTYMKSKGTDSNPDDAYNRTIWGLPALDNTEYPLNWDQRHDFLLYFKLKKTGRWAINCIGQIQSPLPCPDSRALTPNQDRLRWQSHWSVKASVTFCSYRLKLSPYLHIVNIFNNKTVLLVNAAGLQESDIYDPSFHLPGRRILLGINCNFR